MKILLIDNYDSFTFNLFHILEQYDNADVTVLRNDEVSLDIINDFNAIILSPGPGLPAESKELMAATEMAIQSTKVLGVCLGHQAIAQVCGAGLKNLEAVCHGQSLNTNVLKIDDPVFKDIPKVFRSGRYHSWVIDPDTLPKELTVTAGDDQGNIMAIRHVALPVWGIQFHPESILTEYGKELVFNWLSA
ncbi:MAG TPA: aminodeoxychorismate/anthranilate synthase component II [Bacteroidia bacterium]|nr:aminodeoxychorismate/anthranilate synthase component II [Bacteroidia bacterium]HNS12907.1 aminodeoxychorismate/anthranilate synthase component II [Bacteroidia bacterium]